jgi:hypothetical protein
MRPSLLLGTWLTFRFLSGDGIDLSVCLAGRVPHLLPASEHQPPPRALTPRRRVALDAYAAEVANVLHLRVILLTCLISHAIVVNAHQPHPRGAPRPLCRAPSGSLASGGAWRLAKLTYTRN